VARRLPAEETGSSPLGIPAPLATVDRSERVPDAEPARGARRFRLLKAYWVTFQVLGSYLSLNVWAKFLGRDWADRRTLEKHRLNARRIERAIHDLKGLFIKVGQLISIMTNFLPEDFRRELEGLQDQMPPRPIDEIEGRIREELGKGPEEIFAWFDPTPIASASLGQVHEARLPDGRRVAVKVQHLDIDEIVKMDLRAIRRILGIVQWFVPVQGLDAYYSQVREMVLAELDFAREADHIERIAANFAADGMVSFPRVVRDLSTRRVLTTLFVEGMKVKDKHAIDSHGIDRKNLAKRILTAYCQMIFVDGVYHADPHPGNILVRPDGGIVFLDFGAVAELSPQMKEGIPRFLEGVIRRDTEKILAALRTMGFISRAGSDDVSERVIEYFHRRFQEEVRIESLNLKDIKVDPQATLENIADFRKLDISIRELTSTFQVPKDWVLLERTLLLLMGLCTHLDPDMNPMTTIRPYLEEFVLGRDRDWTELIVSAVKDMALSAMTIPDDFKRYLAKAMKGDLEMRFRGMRESANLVYAASHQLLWGILALGAGTLGYVAHVRREEMLSWSLAGGAGFFLLCLAGSLLGARKWRKGR
jgi:predicted unusual protein kinase regulating ubiquinone biosynthesis (AarF/ABC1/UbiB family)